MTDETKYREAMSEIESIVELLENNDPDIDNMIENIKKASELIQLCKEKLRSAENELKQIF